LHDHSKRHYLLVYLFQFNKLQHHSQIAHPVSIFITSLEQTEVLGERVSE